VAYAHTPFQVNHGSGVFSMSGLENKSQGLKKALETTNLQVEALAHDLVNLFNITVAEFKKSGQLLGLSLLMLGKPSKLVESWI
jgi:hypothetical protein